jgi:hypothetical protein
MDATKKVTLEMLRQMSGNMLPFLVEVVREYANEHECSYAAALDDYPEPLADEVKEYVLAELEKGV